MSNAPFHHQIFAADRPPVLARVQVPRSRTACVLGLLAPLVQEGHPLYCADGGNHFDPYAFGQFTRQRGQDPEPLLERVFVSRAFTIHQIHAVVAELLPPLVHAPPPRPLVAVLAIDNLFLEESLPQSERRFVFGDLLDQLEELNGKGLPILVTCDPPSRSSTWWAMLRQRRAFAEYAWREDPESAIKPYPTYRHGGYRHG